MSLGSKNQKNAEKKEDSLLIYGEYSKLIETIKNLDTEQTRYRYATSQYMLGSFAVIGILYFTKLNIEHFAPLVVGIAIPWLAILLITPNLMFDLALLEKLRLSCLSEAILYEKKYNWLPNYHRCLVDEETGRHHGGAHQKINFYLGIVFFEMLISALSICILILNKALWMMLIPLAIVVIPFLLYRLFVLKAVGESEKILHNLEKV